MHRMFHLSFAPKVIGISLLPHLNTGAHSIDEVEAATVTTIATNYTSQKHQFVVWETASHQTNGQLQYRSEQSVRQN